MSERVPVPATTSRAEGFAPTQWSVVLGARKDATDRRAALEKLCRIYWPPVYGYLRRRGHSPADAEDLTQAFFADLLEGDFLDRPDPDKGRFRGYLVGALRHFLSRHFEQKSAQKRGHGAQFIDWSSTDAEREFATMDQVQDPSDAYETSWALTLLARALQRLEAEQTAAGRTHQFAVLKSYLSATPSRGEYEQAAATLGTSRTTVAVWIHRLNQRYAELVKLEVAETVQDAGDVQSEMRHLLQALRR